VKHASTVFLALLISLMALPAHGMAGGVGAGMLGTDRVLVGHFRCHWAGLLWELLADTPPNSVIVFGATPSESGFLDDRGLSSAFLGAGYRFDVGREDPATPPSLYVTTLAMAFPDEPDDELNLGGAVTFGIQRATTFASGLPGGYFAEVGTMGCREFVTVFFQVGLFAGE